MTRPTFKAVLLFALAAPAALLTIAVRPDWWSFALIIPGAVLSFLAADLSMMLPSRRLTATVSAPPRLFVGDEGQIKVWLEIAGAWPSVRLEALLEFSGETETPRPASGVAAEGGLTLNFPICPPRRGQVKLEAVWLRWRGPLGLMERRRRDKQADTRIDVVPNVRGLHETALRFFANDAVYGFKAQRPGGDGSEFDKLRDYAPGLDSRFIDWKRSAHHRKLLCKEFRQERNHQVVFGFDTGHLMLEPVDGLPKLDHAIRAALTLGWVSLKSGDFVGGCGFDARFRSFIAPGRGPQYFPQLQRFSAALDYRTEETNFTLGLAELGARLKRRALVTLFTEFVDSISAELLLESLQRLSRRHLVIFVTMRDPLPAVLMNAEPRNFEDVAQAVIADDFARERAVVLERAARMGVHCLDLPAAEISSALLNRYLAIKQRSLL